SHAIPDAFGSQSLGWPPSTGTIAVSHGSVVYAMRDPSGVNTGLIFARLSVVNCCGSPSGSSFTYTCPAVRKEPAPRRNVSIRPSGDSAGWVTESGKFVSCVHSERDAGWPLGDVNIQIAAATTS